VGVGGLVMSVGLIAERVAFSTACALETAKRLVSPAAAIAAIKGLVFITVTPVFNSIYHSFSWLLFPLATTPILGLILSIPVYSLHENKLIWVMGNLGLFETSHVQKYLPVIHTCV
jgi:hypothetical protein